MNFDTEKLLGVLEFYKDGSKMFAWDSVLKGYFTIWNLLISEGFVRSIEPDKAIKHWQNIEVWGTPTNQMIDRMQYAPLRRERKNSSWHSDIRRERGSYYQALVYFLEKSLQYLQAYTITGFANPDSLNKQQFELCIVLGQTSSQDWICLTPTVLDQVWHAYPCDRHPDITSLTSCVSDNSDTQDIVGKINKILERLKPIEIYGYYYADYRYSYEHQIFCTSSSDFAEAIELALQASTMLDLDGKFWLYDYNHDDWDNHRDRISRFMQRHLKNRKCFTVSFWDVGCGYDLGCTPTDDWIGFKYDKWFIYNP